MAWLDVHHWPERDALVVNCQASFLSALPTRFVIPLLDEEAGYALPRLNPSFVFEGRRLIFVPQLATTSEIRELGEIVGTIVTHEYRIIAAIDFLITGV